MQKNLDQMCVNTIRTLVMDVVQKANSGHPGMPMGMADAAYVLWTEFLKHNPADPTWADRDRFVLSAGHGSTLLAPLDRQQPAAGPAWGIPPVAKPHPWSPGIWRHARCRDHDRAIGARIRQWSGPGPGRTTPGGAI